MVINTVRCALLVTTVLPVLLLKSVRLGTFVLSLTSMFSLIPLALSVKSDGTAPRVKLPQFHAPSKL
jgi:hypothetical protein